MGQYILRRVLQAIPLLIMIAVTTFILLRLVGDPLEARLQDPRLQQEDRARLRAIYGVDDPIQLQFVYWLIGDDWQHRDVTGDKIPDVNPDGSLVMGERRGILRGDFGETIVIDPKNQPVVNIVAQRIPNTLILGLSAYAVTLIVSLGIGIFAALRPYTATDNAITGVMFIFYSMPIYLIAFILLFVFGVQARLIYQNGIDLFGQANFGEGWFPYFPLLGQCPIRTPNCDVATRVWHMVLPVASLAIISIAGYSRFIRAGMLEVINSDYIRTARAKGLAMPRITFLHALKNAALPLITLIGLDLPFILGGAVVTEQIFSWNGMGSLFIRALSPIDPPVLQFITLMIAVAVVISQIITDIVYAWVDPRVRFS
jgi:peptide/nickel transport system permease protein